MEVFFQLKDAPHLDLFFPYRIQHLLLQHHLHFCVLPPKASYQTSHLLCSSAVTLQALGELLGVELLSALGPMLFHSS